MRLFLDVECYPNYFLIVFKTEDYRVKSFTLDENNTFDKNRVLKLLSSCETIGFNSRSYDIPMILKACDITHSFESNGILKNLSDELINFDTYHVLTKHDIWTPKTYNHIDIINVIPDKASLKMYGARIHTEFLQDLPYDPSKILTKEEKKEVEKYCVNDVNITIDLYKKIEKEIEIRKRLSIEHGIDLKSKSDAQIAEALFRNKLKIYKPDLSSFEFKYEKPEFLKFNNEELLELENKVNSVTFKGIAGDKIKKDEVSTKFTVNNKEYKLGIGGLHSTENAIYHIINEDEFLIDIDVTSYYPSIILNNKICPQNIGDNFFKIYNTWYEERIKAKLSKNENLSWVLKIILNGAFGKFNSKYSILYCPKSLIQTTLTGQLSLIMLIEQLEENGFFVISANTDGMTVKGFKNKYDLFKRITENWEIKTNFKLEEVSYKSIFIQSVNNYIAIKEDNSLKLKGIFANNNLSKNPTIEVCKKAILNYIRNKIDVEDTIYSEEINPCNFLKVRKVKDGGYYKGKYLGKIVRWYWSNEGEPILNYKGDKVADSDFAIPIMNLNEKMININYDKYIDTTYKLLESLGLEDVRKNT